MNAQNLVKEEIKKLYPDKEEFDDTELKKAVIEGCIKINWGELKNLGIEHQGIPVELLDSLMYEFLGEDTCLKVLLLSFHNEYTQRVKLVYNIETDKTKFVSSNGKKLPVLIGSIEGKVVHFP